MTAVFFRRGKNRLAVERQPRTRASWQNQTTVSSFVRYYPRLTLNARECGLLHVSADECGRMRFFWCGVDVVLT